MPEFIFQEEYNQLIGEMNIREPKVELSEINEMWKEILDINEHKVLFADSKTQISELSRLYIIEYYYLAMAAGDDTSNEVQFILKSLLIGIANTALCIYKNSFDGFKYQTKVLLRNLYEQGLVFLNVLLDKEKRTALLSASSQEAEYEMWRKYFKPKKMHKTIADFEKKLGKEWSNDWHTRLYGDLSSYAHNDFLSLLVTSYFIPEDEDEEMKINICGCFADRVDNTLDQLNGILFFVGMNFLKIISSEYSDVTKEMICIDIKDESNNKDFWNKATFLEFLNRKCFLKMFWESHASEESIVT